MKPIKFKHQNCTYAEDQPQYLPLPALRLDDTEEKEVITCWKLSFREKVNVLVTGKIWLGFLTFGKPLQPIKCSVIDRELYSHPDFEKKKLFDRVAIVKSVKTWYYKALIKRYSKRSVFTCSTMKCNECSDFVRMNCYKKSHYSCIMNYYSLKIKLLNA